MPHPKQRKKRSNKRGRRSDGGAAAMWPDNGAAGVGAGGGTAAGAGGGGAASGAAARRVRKRGGVGAITAADVTPEEPELVFEDPYGDDLESEEEVIDSDAVAAAGAGGAGAMEVDDDDETEEPTRVWRPGDALPEGTQLEYESSAYHMYHKMTADWPCLSFDVLRDRFGQDRTKFPHTAYIVAGTQADVASKNALHVIKVSEMRRTMHDTDSEGDSDVDEDAVVDFRSFAHPGGVNRVRCMSQEPHIVASWADTGKVHLWDARPLAAGMDHARNNQAMRAAITAGAKQTLEGHASEGWAMDWSPVQIGRLATGDCKSHLYVWDAEKGGNSWRTDRVPYSSHTDSVEDIQWSPVQATVFASCSVDTTFRVWDTRAKTSKIAVNAHEQDVNVISWNKNSAVPHLLATGSDDCSFKVWDLRYVRTASPTPVAHFKWHTKPIVSVEWHPSDETSLVVASADGQVTLWDMSVEADTTTNESKSDPTLEGVPPQLLFVHQGQQDVKEVHHHPQVPDMVISTAADGFNFFIADLTPPDLAGDAAAAGKK